MTIKEKFSSIDQSKLTAEQKSFLSKIKNVTKNFSIEDKDVNDKVEGALDKMIATLKEKMPEAIKSTSTARPKKRSVMSVAKDIRKDGEDFTEAKKRATKKIAEDKESAKETIKSELDKLNDFIKSRKTLSDIKGTNLLRDAKRKAKPVGRRLSKTGRVYYEYRDSKTDRLSPDYPKNAPYLAGGGEIESLKKELFRLQRELNSSRLQTYRLGDVSQEAIDRKKEREVKLARFNEVLKQLRESDAKFELGGSVVTDLAGHTGGGNGGFNARVPLDGFSNTLYTGLVGETGAMSSGEMFMNGGGVAMANQQVIDDASQGYVNYYLGEGASQGIYKDGGAIMNQYAGRTPEDVWDNLNETQRKHFLLDHYHFLDDAEEVEQIKLRSLDNEGKEYINNYSNKTWKKLSGDIRKAFTSHVKEGQYAKGGGVRKVGNREYSYGRNWTNDQRHVNKSEEHEVKYTRKGKFLGIFDGGGIMADGRLILRTFNGIGGNKNKTYSLIKDDRDSDGKPYYTLVEKPSGNIMAQGDSFVEVNNVANIFSGSFAGGGSVTNERKHVNKDEDYEVRYSKPRPSRKGYLGKRDFMAGGMVETPRIYVADLEAYNSGKLVGEWLDLTDYNDADELMEAIQNVLKKSGGEEYAIHDYEYLPSSMYSEYMGYKDFVEIYEMMDLAKENDLPLDVVMDIVSQFDRSALDEFQGVYDSEQDFAEQLVDDIGITSFNDFQYYLEISETDRRLLAQEEADTYVDDIRNEDGGNRLIEEADLDVEEYEEADSDRQEEMLDEAREIVYDRLYDRWYDSLDDPYSYLVEELGYYDADSFADANFIRVDYEKLADALEQDYTFVRHDGKVYVFNIR